MNVETLEALKASISAWEGKLAEENPENIRTGATACPLCRLFYYYDCRGCPVKEKTGKPLCSGTPYNAASNARLDWLLEVVTRKDFQLAAQAEIDFLKSLLPKETV